jgi:peptide methionine sulfoxide reductase msrA/msrB
MRSKCSILFLSILTSLSGCAQDKSDSSHSKNLSQLNLSEQEWKEKLSPEQYYILREKGTEKAFTGEFVFTNDEGIYKCAGCGEELFTDDMKFESHCGWPSFDREIEGGKIIQSEDTTFGMRRTEITCAKCSGHLGHIFDDGPTKTGLRYCVNSASLSFEPKNAPSTMDTLTLGGGCFWCIEAIFEELKGVKSVISGYSGGNIENPTYKEVYSGNTGHAEVVQIVYDSKTISMVELLEVFFTLHDPTTLNKQGADVGTQYRSVIFYRNDVQKNTAESAIQTLNENKVFDSPVVTKVDKFEIFYQAENYHQEYYELNKTQPYCKAVITPKMYKLHKVFNDKIKP